jgi:hypothetical protein
MATAMPNEYVQDDGTVAYDEEGNHPRSPRAREIRVKLTTGQKTLEIV